MKQHPLIEDCITGLLQGKNILQEVENKGVYENIGGHIRHCLDFVDCLTAGLSAGRIDYNQRTRDVRIERDCKFASAKINEAIAKLQSLSSVDFSQTILVRRERANDLTSEESWCGSTLARELEFMQSHTVHHYAIINLKLAMLGIKIDEDLGVAASTLKYRKQTV
jgi:hypothetical protein